MGSEIEDGQGKGVKPRINRHRRETENEIKKKEEEERIWAEWRDIDIIPPHLAQLPINKATTSVSASVPVNG